MKTSYHAGDKLVLVLAQVEPHGLDLEAHLLAHVAVGGEDLGPLHLGELLHLKTLLCEEGDRTLKQDVYCLSIKSYFT